MHCLCGQTPSGLVSGTPMTEHHAGSLAEQNLPSTVLWRRLSSRCEHGRFFLLSRPHSPSPERAALGLGIVWLVEATLVFFSSIFAVYKVPFLSFLFFSSSSGCMNECMHVCMQGRVHRHLYTYLPVEVNVRCHYSVTGHLDF